MKRTLHSDGEHRGWPGHLLWGHVRTSTAVLLIAFFGAAWLYETYKPPEPAEQSTTQVVPPGFVPDPAYTWVPRTKVWTTTPETTRSETPTTTTSTETTESTSPTDTTAPGETPTTTAPEQTTGPTPTAPTPTPTPTTTPTTLTPGQTPQTTAENRSGTPAVPGTNPPSGTATPRGPG